MASDANSFFRIGRDGVTAKMRRCGRAWKELGAEFGESVLPTAARAIAGIMQPEALCWSVCTGSTLITTTDGVVKAARTLKANGMLTVGCALRRLLWDVSGSGANAAEAMQTSRPQVVHVPLAPRRRCVRRVDSLRYGASPRRVSGKDWRANGA